jgi:hypothetical protein
VSNNRRNSKENNRARANEHEIARPLESFVALRIQINNKGSPGRQRLLDKHNDYIDVRIVLAVDIGESLYERSPCHRAI